MAMELQALGPEGREELAARVLELNKKHAVAIMTLTTQEEKAAYIKGIPEEVRLVTRHATDEKFGRRRDMWLLGLGAFCSCCGLVG